MARSASTSSLRAWQEPANPNKVDEIACRGERVFASAGCSACHAPRNYTNGMLIAADGFTPTEDAETAQAPNHARRKDRYRPRLGFANAEGDGLLQTPSLRGVWHRTYLEHSGSVASLEDWFERNRLRDDYVPSGWKGPGVKHRAVPGHEFGLDLPPGDKSALIAFLRTL